MRRNRVFGILVLAVIIFFAVGSVSIIGAEQEEHYLEIELKRLEETYRLLDRFAEKIWPGWDNYNEIEFTVRFPNLVYLVVNPRKSVPEGYEQLQNRTVRGKAIFINRKEELAIKLKPPLVGGGGGGLRIRIRLRQVKLPPGEQPGDQPTADSDGQILLYVHEFFHGFQQKYGRIGEEGDALNDFNVNTAYATWSNIEGLALLKAYSETDDAGALEHLKNFAVAREIKHKGMPPEVTVAEQSTALAEGTATYANIKMAMLLRDTPYRAGISPQDDPFFYNYKFMDAYIKSNLAEDLQSTMESTLDKIGKCYAFGAYQCFVLDRFVPGWKLDFFRDKKTLDSVIAKFLHLSPGQKKEIAGRLKTRYPYDDLYARHDAVIKERDQAVEMIRSRKGTTYIVDFQKTREFPVVKPRGKTIRIDVEQIFLHGIETLNLGEVELSGVDTPMHRTWLYTFAWVDTDPAAKGKKGYEMTFREKSGDLYKGVILKTGGFTLKAPEIRIEEDKDKNEVRILILKKCGGGVGNTADLRTISSFS